MEGVFHHNCGFNSSMPAQALCGIDVAVAAVATANEAKSTEVPAVQPTNTDSNAQQAEASDVAKDPSVAVAESVGVTTSHEVGVSSKSD